MSELWRENQATKAARVAAAIARKHARLADVPGDVKDAVADAAAIATNRAVKSALLGELRWFCSEHFDPLSASAAGASRPSSRSSGNCGASHSAKGRTPASASRASGPAASSSLNFGRVVNIKLEPGTSSTLNSARASQNSAAKSSTKKMKLAHSTSQSTPLEASDEEEDHFVDGAFLGSRPNVTREDLMALDPKDRVCISLTIILVI